MITDKDYANDINRVILEEREWAACVAESFASLDGEHRGTCERIAKAIRRGVDPETGDSTAHRKGGGNA